VYVAGRPRGIPLALQFTTLLVLNVLGRAGVKDDPTFNYYSKLNLKTKFQNKWALDRFVKWFDI